MQEIGEYCPVCELNTFSYLYHSSFNQFNLPIYLCSECKLQTIYPKPIYKPEEMYSEKYYTGKAEYTYKDERNTKKFDSYVWDARIKNIKKFVKKGKFLDIGSSFGGFLERAKIAGFDTYGVEVSPFSSEFSRKNGLEIYTGEYLDNPYGDNFFNVITLVEVIEHLLNPDLVFKKLYSQLQTNGLLLLQTANFEGQQAIDFKSNYHYYLPGHLYYYSKSNLEKILKKVGFRKTIMYYGVDFPLYAKLLKSRGSFHTIKDYLKWWSISKYHLKSRLFPGSTSSMVMYAFR